MLMTRDAMGPAGSVIRVLHIAVLGVLTEKRRRLGPELTSASMAASNGDSVALLSCRGMDPSCTSS